MNARASRRQLSIAFLVSLIACITAASPHIATAQSVSAPAANAVAQSVVPAPAGNVSGDAAAAARVAMAQLPLSFEANQGQAAGPAQFLARGHGYRVFVDAAGAMLALSRSPRRTVGEPDKTAPVEQTFVRMTIAGSDPRAAGAALEELPGKVNYFRGNDPRAWRTNVATYRKVSYRDVYPGVDLVYYGNGRQLEYDFVVAPGADPRAISLGFEGVGALAVDAEGDLVLPIQGSHLRLRKPVAYQEIGGTRRNVPVRYEMTGDRRVAIRVAAYDTTKTLVIDPVLVYSTYIGGGGEDNASGIVVDTTGIYVAGLTVSFDYPMGGTPFQGAIGGDYDAYVTKLNPAGTALIYSTYLGGTSTDYGLALAVDGSGNAYVAGLTASTDFPTAGTPFQSSNGGGFDAYLAKLSPNGSALLYATYLGGDGDDIGFGVAVDGSGNAYVTGRAGSGGFPTAGTPYQGTIGGAPDAFVAKLNPSASGAASLVYSTFLGGNGDERANGIVVDSTGNAYVTGRTTSTNFPTVNAFQATFGGSGGVIYDAFVAKLDATGTNLLYSTYLGGSGDDRGFSIARDASNNVYITGRTLSTNFPTTAGAFDTTCGTDGTCDGGFMDAFVAKLNPGASGAASLIYSTYLGGGRDDEGQSIAVDSAGNAYVTGYTDSTNFPTANALQPQCGSGCSDNGFVNVFVDAFVTRLNAPGSATTFSTYLGGSSADYGIGIFVDASSNIYITGESFSDNFPMVSPYNGTWSGNYDVIVAKISSTATSANLGVVTDVSPDPATAGSSVTYTFTISNGGSDSATGVRLIVRFPQGSVSVGSFGASQGTCALVNSFFYQEVRCDLGTLANAGSATVTGLVTPFFAGTVSTAAHVSSNVSDPAGANNESTRDLTVNTPPTPTVTNIQPASGSVAGGTAVTITGTNFQSGATVSLGGVDATGVTVVGPDTITATTGAHAAGTVDVVVTNPDAQSGTLTNGFTYATAPTITNFTPVNGPAGTSVTINGTNLAGATSVTFNGVAASITSNTATQIHADVPVNATTGKVAVTTAGGTATSTANFTVKPNITGFTPPSGGVGATVTINGTGFTGATSVKFDGRAATIPPGHSSTQIVTTVPMSATTGKITVTTPGGTAISATDFVVAPRITSFSPVSGSAGASVIITGANFANVTSVTLNGVAASHVVNSTTRITATVPAAATTGPIVVNATGGTGTSASNFTVVLTPTITNFTPGSGGTGVNVTINGTHFTGVTSVKFNGVAAVITSKTDTQVKANVPATATTGPITVTTPAGTATSASNFTVAPRITTFAPTSGVIGANVTINGANFTGATQVTFNGTAASFTVNSAIKITATVPAGATKGKIAVTTAAGTALSTAMFTVKPTISGFTPPSGDVGATVTINGTGLSGATSVRFNGRVATIPPSHPDTQIVTTVPAGATTGPITVTTPGGTVTSATDFVVAPRITSFTPASGAAGATVTINGANFTGATAVRFNGVAATHTVVSSVRITATVPATATTGKISVTTPAGTATSTADFVVN